MLEHLLDGLALGFSYALLAAALTLVQVAWYGLGPSPSPVPDSLLRLPSVLLVALTAEEKGLLGAQYFVAHPTVPKPSLVANVNLDMPLTAAGSRSPSDSRMPSPTRREPWAASVTCLPAR